MRPTKLGQRLLLEGQLTQPQLETVLKIQRQLCTTSQPVLLGKLLVYLGYLEAEAVAQQLQLQQLEGRFWSEVEACQRQLNQNHAISSENKPAEDIYVEWEELRSSVALALSRNTGLMRVAFATGYLGRYPIHRPLHLHPRLSSPERRGY